MKKFIIIMAALVAGIVCAATPSRDVGTLSVGAVTITNAEDFVVWQLATVEVAGVQPTSFTGSVVHVQDSITNSLGTISSAGTGQCAITNSSYVFKGGKITISAGTNSAAFYRVVKNVLP